MNWIFLRGLMRETEHWGSFPKEFEAVHGRVVCLDLPGVGTEANKIFVPNVRQMMEDLRSRFRALENKNLNEPWGLLGISLGGMIALEWANHYPQDFQKMIVINSSSRDSVLWERLKLPSMLSVVKIFREKDILKREENVVDMVSNLRKTDKTLAKEWAAISKKSKFSKLSSVSQLIAASTFKLPPVIKTPMLVLTSRADRMVDWKCSQKIAEKYKAPLKIHPTAGHDLPIDDSKWVVETTQEWLKV